MSRFTRVLVFAVALLVSSQACAKSPFSFVKFRKSKSVAQSSMLLTEDNGPWMIFVASFAGGGADAEARQLVETLRTKYRFNAFVHKEHYDFSDSVNGKGFDKHGRPKKMRFASDHAYDEVAVLVGDYESINDPKMQKQMQAIKYATAAELQLKGSKDSPTTRRFAGLRSIQKKLTNRDEKRQKGPLGNAFATRNPMIPREATAPSGIDRLLVDINKGVEYSLLDNPSKYTVRVASFRGQVIIDQKKIQEIEKNLSKTDERINETDEKAEGLAALLRSRGVEAYVYHDRHESIVTIGSFEEIGRKMPNGTIDLLPEVAKIMQAYGPSKKPLAGNRAVSGIQPKAVANGRYIFDIAPQPVLVPRRSIATDYLSNK